MLCTKNLFSKQLSLYLQLRGIMWYETVEEYERNNYTTVFSSYQLKFYTFTALDDYSLNSTLAYINDARADKTSKFCAIIFHNLTCRGQS